MISALMTFLLCYYAFAVLWYWLPLIAVKCRRELELPPDLSPGHAKPKLIVVVPCRGGAAAIPGMVETFKRQDYPADRFRTILLIDREGEADPSVALAQAAGAEVYERRDPEIKTKGGAVNELIDQHLRNESWDALVVIDVDGRVEPHFLHRVAAYLAQGADVIQCAPQSKSADDPLARISHSGQLLSQLIQRGRAALGWPAILSGSCMVLSRSTLAVLNWQTSTGRRLSDDGEMNLRCLLKDQQLRYGPDLKIFNDLPADSRSVRLQRRRWFVARVEGLAYLVPLLMHGTGGHPRALEGMFTLLVIPGSSLAFALAGIVGVGLGITAFIDPDSIGLFKKLLVLWVLHGLYYVVALRTVGGELTREEFRQLPQFLWARVVAVWEGTILANRRDPGKHSIPFSMSTEKPAVDPADKRSRDPAQERG